MGATTALAALLASLLALGCSSAADARFTAADGRQSALRVSSFHGSRHARLAPDEGIPSTGVLHPRASVTVGDGQSLYLEYRSTVAEANVSFLGEDNRELVRYRLTAGGDAPIRRYLAVPAALCGVFGCRPWSRPARSI